jgi:hypothetical protein
MFYMVVVVSVAFGNYTGTGMIGTGFMFVLGCFILGYSGYWARSD